jgi:hypothetical protein
LPGFIGGEVDFDGQAGRLYRFWRLTSWKILEEMRRECVQRRADGTKVRKQRHRLWHQGFWLTVQAKAALVWDQRFWAGTATRGNRGSRSGDVDTLREALGIMPSSLGIREDCIRFHNILEGRGALGTNAVGMIEFGQLAVGMPDIPSCRRPGTGSVEWEWLPILKQSLIQMPMQFSRDPYVVEIPGRMGICMPYVVYPINASKMFVRELFYIQIA